MCRARHRMCPNRAAINDSHRCTHLYRAGQTLLLSRVYAQGYTSRGLQPHMHINTCHAHLRDTQARTHSGKSDRVLACVRRSLMGNQL